MIKLEVNTAELENYIDGLTWVVRYVHYKALENASKIWSKMVVREVKTKDAEKDPWTDRSGKMKESAQEGGILVGRDGVGFGFNIGEGLVYTKALEKKIMRSQDAEFKTNYGKIALIGYFIDSRDMEEEFKRLYLIERKKLESQYRDPSPQQVGALRVQAKKYHFGHKQVRAGSLNNTRNKQITHGN